MAKGDKGTLYPNIYNETGTGEEPDTTGDDLYFGGYDEVLKMHLKETGDMISTPNSDASHDTFGGPAKGEPNPGGMGGQGGK